MSKNTNVGLVLSLMLIGFSISKIIVADIEDIRNLLINEERRKTHYWNSKIDDTDEHMQYGFDTLEGVQYSIICRVDNDTIIPGKISKGKATYTSNFQEKKCESWKYVEGRLVHELDFLHTKCRRPLGKEGNQRFYNGVAHLKTGYVVGKVDEHLHAIEYSRDGVVEIRKNNFYIIC